MYGMGRRCNQSLNGDDGWHCPGSHAGHIWYGEIKGVGGAVVTRVGALLWHDGGCACVAVT
eukprot:scaffold2605_cov21-Tisochrysis_lutea.AAC.1